MAGLLDLLLGGGGGGLLGGQYGGPAYPGGGADGGVPYGAVAGAPAAPSAIPQAAMPAQFAPSAPAAQAMPQQISSPMGGLQSVLNGMLAGVNPAAASAIYERQMTQAALQSLMGRGMSLPQAMITLKNPKVQEALYGAPSQMGTMKLPNGAEIPAYSIHGQAPTYAMPQNSAFAGQLNAPTKLGETKIGEISGPTLYQNGQVTTPILNGGASAPTGQPGTSGGLQGAINLNNQITQQKQKASALGKAQGEATQKLPQALSDTDTAIHLIDQLKADPNLWWATGSVLGRLPAVGEGQAEAVARIDQVKGQAFMQAFQALKGAGVRITNQESVSASNAIARLNRAQSTGDFKSALDDLRNVIVGIRTRAGQMAGGEPTPPPPSGTTKSGIKWSIQ